MLVEFADKFITIGVKTFVSVGLLKIDVVACDLGLNECVLNVNTVNVFIFLICKSKKCFEGGNACDGRKKFVVVDAVFLCKTTRTPARFVFEKLTVFVFDFENPFACDDIVCFGARNEFPCVC